MVRIKARQTLSGHQLTNSDRDKRKLFERPYIRHLVHRKNGEAQWSDIEKIITSSKGKTMESLKATAKIASDVFAAHCDTEDNSAGENPQARYYTAQQELITRNDRFNPESLDIRVWIDQDGNSELQFVLGNFYDVKIGQGTPMSLERAEQALKDIVERHGFEAQLSISVKIKYLEFIELFNEFIVQTNTQQQSVETETC